MRAGRPATFDLLWELYEEERKEAADAAAAAAASAAAEAVATAISAGSAAAAAAAAADGRNDAGGQPQGVQAPSNAGRTDIAVGGKWSAVSGGKRVGAEEGGSKFSDQAGVGFPPASSTAEATASTAAVTEKKIPRRPSTGRPRGGGGGGGVDTQADVRPGTALRRPRSAGDVAPAGAVGGRGSGEGPGMARFCWGGEEGERGEERARRISAEWLLEQEATEEEEEEEREKHEGSEEDLGAETITARRKCSGGRNSGEKRNTTERNQRRKSSRKKSTGSSRRGTGDSPGVSQGRRASAATPWRWKTDLCAILKRMGGLEKVIHRGHQAALVVSLCHALKAVYVCQPSSFHLRDRDSGRRKSDVFCQHFVFASVPIPP